MLADIMHRRGDRWQSRPRSSTRSIGGQAKSQTLRGSRADEAAHIDSPEVTDLRQIVEELLWVVLLQRRCCPGVDPARPLKRGPHSNLEERLSMLLVQAIGPALRPVARRVLAPASRLVRQILLE